VPLRRAPTTQELGRARPFNSAAVDSAKIARQ
jgi:hypothetical protein